MNTVNDKKSKRMIIKNAKESLKKNAELIKQEFNIEIPKNILNMDNIDFYSFIANTVHPTITNEGWVAQEIGDVVSKLEACIRACKHYYREPKTL